jgi:hypothetical protein
MVVWKKLRRWWAIVTTDPEDLDEVLEEIEGETETETETEPDMKNANKKADTTNPLAALTKYSTFWDRATLLSAVLASLVTSTTTFTWYLTFLIIIAY